MFNAIKSWLRPPDNRKYGEYTAYHWAAALRDDFPYFNEDPAPTLRAGLDAHNVDADLPILICTHDNVDVRILSCVLATVESRTDCHAALLAALNDPSDRVRRAAAIALVKMDTIAGLSAVVAGKLHGKGIRTQAAYRLAEHGPAAKSAIPALFALINDSDINFRSHWAAGAALKAIGQEAMPYLSHALRYGSGQVRFESAVSLREIGVPVDLQPLVDQILGPESPE